MSKRKIGLSEKSTQARRAYALSRPELRGVPFFIDIDEKLPDPRTAVLGFASSNGNQPPYRLPFPVARIDDKWFNARTGKELDQVRIVGWKLP